MIDSENNPLGASWERIAGIYEQAVNAHLTNKEYVPPEVLALLAELLSRVSASYYQEEVQFATHAWQTFKKARTKDRDNISCKEIYHEQLGAIAAFAGQGRRKPASIEAAIETIRRLRDVYNLEKALAPLTVAALLGGSASYGKFINVRGGDAPSDIDVLLVLESYSNLKEIFSALSAVTSERGEKIVSSQHITGAISRAEGFGKFIVDSEKAAIFSAKFELWKDISDPIIEDCEVPSQYTLSLHVFDRTTFGKLLLEDRHTIDPSIIGFDHVILDYRETKPNRTDNQRSFSGVAHEFNIEASDHEASHIRSTKMFAFHENKYFPGMLQNLVLPVFDIRWGNNDCRRLLDSFRWKLIDRLRFELRAHPNELLRLSFAHTRSSEFAPHVVRAIDQSTVIG